MVTLMMLRMGDEDEGREGSAEELGKMIMVCDCIELDLFTAFAFWKTGS